MRRTQRECGVWGPFERCWRRAGRRVVVCPGRLPTWCIVRGTVWAVLPDWATGTVREMMLCWLATVLVVECMGEDAAIQHMRRHDVLLLMQGDDTEHPQVAD